MEVKEAVERSVALMLKVVVSFVWRAFIRASLFLLLLLVVAVPCFSSWLVDWLDLEEDVNDSNKIVDEDDADLEGVVQDVKNGVIFAMLFVIALFLRLITLDVVIKDDLLLMVDDDDDDTNSDVIAK